ncbi:peptide/nickel transport system permease protein [Paenibacillus sp. UNC496MF]|uniref:ABC transporter permease n=1 Tax=Paenibacillus sp. UNC496MF TaxID=1502753 RepID=UPI0008E9686A|nr:ABC transporter permease [Paenibacillus sp. UNC496MF]SFJ70948.1 peptide/nickel transport system permease protein [Paenibacillus sp. UNC496MF]
MWEFIVRRTLQSIFVLLVVSAACFYVSHKMPGDMWTAIGMTQEQRLAADAQKHALGLDLPLHEQYWNWLKGLRHGGFGLDYQMQPIGSYIWKNAQNSLILIGASWLLSVMIAFPWAIYSSIRSGGLSDRVAIVLALVGFAVPGSAAAIWLQQVFAFNLYWLPPSSIHTPSKQGNLLDLIQHMILPVATLMLGIVASYLKFIRSSMQEVLPLDFLQTARAKGISEKRVILVHALKNAMIPVVTIAAMDLPALIGSSAIVENVFNWGGLGSLMVYSAGHRNLPVLIAVIIIITTAVVLFSWVADIVSLLLNPRIRLGRKAA